MSGSRSVFPDLLVEKGILPRAECAQLMSALNQDPYCLLLHLVEVLPHLRDELGRLWGDAIGFAYVDLDRTILQARWMEKLPPRFARENLVIPLYEMGGAVTFAAAHPEDPRILQTLENSLDEFVSFVFAFPDQIETTLDIAEQSTQSLADAVEGGFVRQLSGRRGEVSLAQLTELAGDDAVIGFTNGLLFLALKQHATDVHIEPEEFGARVRFRVDGVLREVLRLDCSAFRPVVSRLKVMADADIAETARPHDGRISLPVGSRPVDMRFSSVPTLHGEKVVLRILGRSEYRAVPLLDDLLFARPVREAVDRALKAPNGVFLLTGPTGSGKTTTLYAMLRELNQPGVNIMTVEDPVEYRLPGLNQLQVNEAKDVRFSTALRAFLRQDPDIILVGEVRDEETARTALQAAMTGHLVLSTLHTNGAPEAVTRLLDLGLEPYLVAPALVGIMAQRLVRRLCDNCRERYPAEPELLDRFFEHDGRTVARFYRPSGCEQCDGIGYRGRLAIHEVLLASEALCRAVIERAPAETIRGLAGPEFAPLRRDGLKKALQGYTSLEEIERVTVE